MSLVDEIKRAAEGRWHEVLRRAGVRIEPPEAQPQGDELRCLSPLRSDAHAGSFCLNVRTGLFHDFSGKGDGDAFTLVQLCCSCDFPEAISKLAAALGIAATGPAPQKAEVQETTAAAPSGRIKPAPPDVLDRVYSTFLGAVTLSNAHRENLLKRGLSAEEIQLRGYRTLDRSRTHGARAVLDAGLVNHLPYVPGFVYRTTDWNSERTFWSCHGKGGILIPVRDSSRRIIALKLRLDEPGPAGKYRYLSSKKSHGAGPGSPLHYPIFQGNERSIVRVTEGELKADIATVISGILTISLPGVASWRRAARALRELGAKVVRVAFDADANRKFSVAEALWGLTKQLFEAGFMVELEVWSEGDGKGIDDLLVVGKSAEVVSGAAAQAAVEEILSQAQKCDPEAAKHAKTRSASERQEQNDGVSAIEMEVQTTSGAIREHIKALLFLIIDKKDQDKKKDGEKSQDPESRLQHLLDNPEYYEIAIDLARKRDLDFESLKVLVKVVIEAMGFARFVANVIQAGDHFAVDAGREVYVFQDGVYGLDGELHIRQKAKTHLESWGHSTKWGSKKILEVVEYISVDSRSLWPAPPREEINVLNGILHVRTRTLRPHDPEFLSQVRIPVKYDPAATCPAIDAFVKQVFPEDAQDLAYELPANLMVPEPIQKAMLLQGGGGNGKSTYLTLLTNFLGRDNVSNLSLQRLETDRFATSSLLGKLANICPDIPGERLTGTSMFKAITGQDRIMGERKFKPAFEFEPFARLVFSANTPPQTNDGTDAYFTRWIVAHFGRGFRGTKHEVPRSIMDARLATPAELSGFLNRALDALPRVLERGFTISPSMIEAHRAFRELTDPFTIWFEANLIVNPLAFVAKQDLKRAFNAFASKEGKPLANDTSLTLALKRWKADLADGQKRLNGKPTWCWLGIGLQKEGADNEAPQAREGLPVNGDGHLAVARGAPFSTAPTPRAEVVSNPPRAADVTGFAPPVTGFVTGSAAPETTQSQGLTELSQGSQGFFIHARARARGEEVGGAKGNGVGEMNKSKENPVNPVTAGDEGGAPEELWERGEV